MRSRLTPATIRRTAAPIAALWIVAVIALAQALAPAGYDWTRNTVSELAAQGYARKGIMQAGFIGFGLLLAAAPLATLTAARGSWRPWLREAPLLVYALALAGSGVACTAPFEAGVPFAAAEARWHSVFATGAGIGLSLSLAAHAFTDPAERRRPLHLAALVVVAGLSFAFGLVEGSGPAGLVQRVLYATGFGWIALVYPRTDLGPARAPGSVPTP